MCGRVLLCIHTFHTVVGLSRETIGQEEKDSKKIYFALALHTIILEKIPYNGFHFNPEYEKN